MGETVNVEGAAVNKTSKPYLKSSSVTMLCVCVCERKTKRDPGKKPETAVKS